jgi:tetratricopeptide (TPR) repeat protein
MKTFLVASAVLASWLAIDARSQAATPSDTESAASALVAEAARAYDQNQLDEALRLLARAYELSPRPSILYNQAQVLRTKNDCVAALDAYQRFIAATTPDDPNRERALNRRTEMQTCVDKQTPSTKPEESPSTPPDPATAPAEAPAAAATGPVRLAIAEPAPPVQAPPSPADDSGRGRRRAMRVTGWALVGVGVLAAGTAAVLAWHGHSIQEELNTTGSRWTQAREDEGRQASTLARWFGAAAAVAGGGGAALLMVTRPTAATGDAPGTASAALVGWSGTF